MIRSKIPLTWGWVVCGLVCVSCRASRSGFDDLDQAAAEMDSAAQAYRAAGLPWLAKDVRSGAPVPADKNAARLIRAAAKGYSSKRYYEDSPVIRSAIAGGSYAKADSLLSRYSASLDIAVRATELPDIDFARDWDLGPAVLFSELAPMKQFATMLSLRAQVECAKHDARRALRDLKAAWRLGALAGRDPDLIGMLAQIAIQRITLHAVGRCCYALTDDPSSLAELSNFLAEAQAPDLAYSIRGEAYMGICVVRNLKAFGGLQALSDPSQASDVKFDPKALIRTGLPKDRDSKALAARHFQTWTEVEKLANRYRGDPIELQKSLEQLNEKVEARQTASNVLNLIIVPNLGTIGTTPLLLKAEVVASRAMLVAAQIRAHTGKSPDSIVDIPGSWTDPFTGQPMKFRLTEGGFRIYSVGPNLKDDGGVFRSELDDHSSKEYDVGAAFEPERPVRRSQKDGD